MCQGQSVKCKTPPRPLPQEGGEKLIGTWQAEKIIEGTPFGAKRLKTAMVLMQV
jgi:hypothetical protein